MPADQDAKGTDPVAEHKNRARWRLLGALILVGAVAAVAPILLEDQARPLSQDLLIEISPRAAAPVPQAAPEPVKTESVETQPSKAEPSKTQPPKLEPPKAEPVRAAPAKIESPKSEAQKAEPLKPLPLKTEPLKKEALSPEPQKLPATKQETVKAESFKKAQGFMVQVGAYATLDAANRIKARLEGAGHRVTIQTIKTAEGAERHRVRIGPFETRDQANEVRDRAKSQGYDAAVVAAS
jgi:DedD protein